jgi:hypothetical protein
MIADCLLLKCGCFQMAQVSSDCDARRQGHSRETCYLVVFLVLHPEEECCDTKVAAQWLCLFSLVFFTW